MSDCPYADALGIELTSTWWQDFSIADAFGADAIRDTYEGAIEHWSYDLDMMVDLTLVLNWKSWQHNELGNYAFVDLYVDLFHECQDFCYDNLPESDIREYFHAIFKNMLGSLLHIFNIRLPEKEERKGTEKRTGGGADAFKSGSANSRNNDRR